jgi:hypothetical protein
MRLIKKIDLGEFVIISDKHPFSTPEPRYWRKRYDGYTLCITEAHHYPVAEALTIKRNGADIELLPIPKN